MWPLLEELKTCDEYKLYKKKSDDDEYVPKGVELNKDDPNHMSWIYNRALERAKQFNINGVTYKLTQQVFFLFYFKLIPKITTNNK